jgi:Mg2+-importing ATPase
MLLTGAIIAIGCYLPFSPIAATIKMTALPGGYWFLLALTTLGYCVLTQIGKQMYIRKFREWM